MGAVATKAPFLVQLTSVLRRFAYNASGFNKYGLMHDDVLYETPDVEEALRRPRPVGRRQKLQDHSSPSSFGTEEDSPQRRLDQIRRGCALLETVFGRSYQERQEKEAWD